MPMVKILDAKYQEVTTAEFSRVPCVGEYISLDIQDDEEPAISYRINHVEWGVYAKDDNTTKALVIIDFWDEKGEFAKKFAENKTL